MSAPEMIRRCQNDGLTVAIREVIPGIWLAEVPHAALHHNTAVEAQPHILSHSGHSPEAAFNALSDLIADLREQGFKISQHPIIMPQNAPAPSPA